MHKYSVIKTDAHYEPKQKEVTIKLHFPILVPLIQIEEIQSETSIIIVIQNEQSSTSVEN